MAGARLEFTRRRGGAEGSGLGGDGVCDAEDGQEGRPADQDLRGVRVALCLAQEVGAGLGGGAVLLGAVSGEG